MSVQQSDPTPSDDLQLLSGAERRRHRSGFWAVAFAFLIVMASATLPSPLYGLYRTRDHLSAFTVTVVFAIFAAGTIAALFSVRFIAVRAGRRGVMLGAVATMMAAAGLLAAWKALPGLLIGRLVTGVAVGLAAGMAITYLIELRLRANPSASPVRARNIGTAVTVGGLGVGPLVAGCLAEWVKDPLTLPYLLFLALGGVALTGLATAPETGTSAPVAASRAGGSSRSVRLLVPGALATLTAFSANGLFAGLSGLILATTLHHHSLALSGAALFLVFSCGVASQLATNALPASRVFVIGTISMLSGLALLVTSVRLSTPSLALFLVSGGLIGAGTGAVFKGTTGLVLEATSPESRLAMTSDLLIALYVGLSIPVIGAGVALDQGASAPDTVLGFAIFVGLGVAGAGALLGHGLSLTGATYGVRRDYESVPTTEVSMSTIDQEMVLAHFIVSDDVERSRRFYTDVLGGKTVISGEAGDDVTYVALANTWVIINVGGGPTDDKPTVTLETQPDPDRVSSFLNIRVADIQAVYAEWSARGAQFLTPPKQHETEIRCYIRDPDGYIIEVGQTTLARGWRPPS